MPALAVNGVTVPIARDQATRDVDDGAHRTVAISGRMLSTRRAAKWTLTAKTVAMLPAAAAALEVELRKAVVSASGDLAGGVARQCHVEMRPVQLLTRKGGALSVFDFTLRET